MAERLLDPVEAVLLERAHAPDRVGQAPAVADAAVDHDRLVGADRLAYGLHEGDVAVVLVAEMRVAELAEADLDTGQARLEPACDLVRHLADVAGRGMARGDRRQAVLDGSAEEVDEARAERLALEVPERDVEARDRKRGDATGRAVPPRLGVQLLADRVRLHGIHADDELAQRLDDQARGTRGVREVGRALAPADLAVVRRDLDEADGSMASVIVRFRIGDGKRLHSSDLHKGLPVRRRRARGNVTSLSLARALPLGHAAAVPAGGCLHDRGLPGQPGRRRARRPRPRLRSDAAVRALDEPLGDDVRAAGERSCRRLPPTHLHAGRRAPVRRTPDARHMPRLALRRGRARSATT